MTPRGRRMLWCFAALLAYVLWTTRWRYFEANGQAFREHRITGELQYFLGPTYKPADVEKTEWRTLVPDKDNLIPPEYR